MLVGTVTVAVLVIGKVTAFTENQTAVTDIDHLELLRSRAIELATVLGVVIQAEFTFGQFTVDLEVWHNNRAPEIHFDGWRIDNAVQTGICIIDVVPVRQYTVDRFIVVHK